MNSITDRATPTMPPAAAPASLAIDNLRAVVIVLVVAFHSVLAYLNFLPAQPFVFDSAPFMWRSFPIVDTHRWMGFDLFCAWLDVFLMSFFMLVSGLFAWPSLMRKGAGEFLHDRVRRLGLPFAAVCLLLMPVALYPTYRQTASDPSLAAYWHHWLALPFWPSGPAWFLWPLLVGGIAVAAVFLAMSGRHQTMVRLSHYARRRPVPFFAGFIGLSVLAYIPLALIFGPSDWAQRGPFAVQLSRPLHYALYFFGGVAIGACGIERGLLATDGPLARRWSRWAWPALLLLLAWMGLTGLLMSQNGAAPLWLQAISDLSFVLACCANVFFVLAAAVRFGRFRAAVLENLKDNAYGMYLVHYVFIVWLQYALLSVGLPAILKGAGVFAGTLAMSWAVSAALRRQHLIAYIIGTERRRQPVAIPMDRLPLSQGTSQIG